MTAHDPATLLIVEDDPGVASFQKTRLQRAGYRVLVAEDGAGAMAQMKSATVDLLVLDHNLPGGLTGLDLYLQIKEAGFDVPAILVTGMSGDNVVLQSLRAGVFDFIPKTPDYINYLMPTIERILTKRRTEYQLAESEARLGRIIGAVMDGVLVVEEDHRLSLWNPAAERMFGCDASEAMGQPVDRFLPNWKADKMAGPEGAAAVETKAVRKDGEEFPVELAVSWVETKRRRFWTCLVRDIRERKRVQEERERLIREQAARKEAETAHAQTTAVAEENARLNQELRLADRRKDEFLAMLAHELRNPLAPIRNVLHLIRLSSSNQVAANPEHLAIMERQVNHLVRLVDDLLDVSRISQGKIHLHKDRLNLAEVVERGIESSKPLIDARRHRLTIKFPSLPLLVEGDAVRLVQVVANLLNNAAKYTPEGGRIEVVLEKSAELPSQADLRIRDSGVGISADMMPHLFDLFTQSERTLDRADGGLGIGLTLVRHLTAMHGGSVQAFSAGLGKGSEFVVHLPLIADTGAKEAARGPGHASEAQARRRVLVVDDNHDSASTLSRLLQILGSEVRIAHDGEQALASALEWIPELVLLDIGLPGINGYDVARQLRADPRFDRTMLVALTGYGGPENRRQSEEAGFNAHFVKPVDLDVLKRLLADPQVLRREDSR